MSRIGKKPIILPAVVDINLSGNTISVKGPKGNLSGTFPATISVTVEKEKNLLTVSRANDLKETRALHGLWRALINNMVIGVSEGFTKTLEVVGTGYRAQAQGKKLTLNIGFSHPVNFEMTGGLEVKTPTPATIIISGCDKQAVGQMAANIRRTRPPEPYKGKGIRYKGEYVRRLAGKSFSTGG